MDDQKLEELQGNIQETLNYLNTLVEDPNSIDQTKQVIALLDYMEQSEEYQPLLEALPHYPAIRQQIQLLLEAQEAGEE